MDDDELGGTLRDTLRDARGEATRAGSKTVEAEHLLLALAARSSGPVPRLLADSGLDRDGIDSALEAEHRRSLAIAGVEPLTAEQSLATPRSAVPVWGSSVREALLRGHRIASKDRRARENNVDVLLGILQAEVGTVPRALAIAGIDRRRLLGRALEAR